MKSKWTLEKLQEEASKYESRTKFAAGSNAAYQRANRMGILDKVCQHMKKLHCEPHTKASLLTEVSKYATIFEFVKRNKSAYNAALRLGILDEICKNLDKMYWRWTDQELQKEAFKYSTRKEFQKGSHSAYVTAINRDILQKLCVHMKKAGDISRAQKELFDFIKVKFPHIKQLKLRKINVIGKPHIKGFDLDIYVPEINKGIEFDGKYWHSTEGLRRSRPTWPAEDIENYHKIKDNFFASKNILVLHIAEIDWLRDKEFCMQKCLKFLES